MRKGKLYFSMNIRPSVQSRSVNISAYAVAVNGNICPMRNRFATNTSRWSTTWPESVRSKWKKYSRSRVPNIRLSIAINLNLHSPTRNGWRKRRWKPEPSLIVWMRSVSIFRECSTRCSTFTNAGCRTTYQTASVRQSKNTAWHTKAIRSSTFAIRKDLCVRWWSVRLQRVIWW